MELYALRYICKIWLIPVDNVIVYATNNYFLFAVSLSLSFVLFLSYTRWLLAWPIEKSIEPDQPPYAMKSRSSTLLIKYEKRTLNLTHADSLLGENRYEKRKKQK